MWWRCRCALCLAFLACSCHLSLLILAMGLCSPDGRRGSVHQNVGDWVHVSEKLCLVSKEITLPLLSSLSLFGGALFWFLAHLDVSLVSQEFFQLLSAPLSEHHEHPGHLCAGRSGVLSSPCWTRVYFFFVFACACARACAGVCVFAFALWVSSFLSLFTPSHWHVQKWSMLENDVRTPKKQAKNSHGRGLAPDHFSFLIHQR